MFVFSNMEKLFLKFILKELLHSDFAPSELGKKNAYDLEHCLHEWPYFVSFYCGWCWDYKYL